MSSVISTLFTEQLRPQSLDQALLVDRVKNQIANELNSPHGIISNILFYGKCGTGKCLDFNESLTVYVDEATHKKLKKFLKK